ncbi:MAG TPA: NAD-dependent epimerase/dehydratase family protein [Gammaproteobacteria bacterium]|nr:NAD-dependent epimerase/dehydratase family protein [Gammaproteobacteria bacterium]
MRYFVTGCAGFIGSHLTDRLLKRGDEVIGLDNFSTGLPEFLADAKQFEKFNFIEGDLLDKNLLIQTAKNCDAIFHLAANADVRFGLHHPHKDLEQNAIGTFHVLEAMRENQIKKIMFASTGSVYGEANIIPTPEDAPFPVQTSLYGASKLAAEGLIQAYAEGFGIQAYLFRFVSILGERYTHGHVFDFYKQLLMNEKKLQILGNGRQKKSYLYIHDCIDAILFAMDHAEQKINVYNLGTDEYCEVNDSIHWICQYLGLTPERYYDNQERGWIGDNPFIFLDCSRIRKLGWKPKLNIQEGVVRTIKYLHENAWVLEKR